MMTTALPSFIDCVHAEKHAHGVVDCAAGVHGPRPSLTICRNCKSRVPGKQLKIAPAPPVMVRKINWGKLWAELTMTSNPSLPWLRHFIHRLPCSLCRLHALNYLRDHPPDFGDGWFDYVTDWRQHVAEAVGTPAVDRQMARRLWGRSDFFAACYVISLERTPDRLAQFHDDFPIPWPWALPELIPAIDGKTHPMPAHWTAGDLANGCRSSFERVMQLVFDQEITRPVLIMEDDCRFTRDAVQTLMQTLDDLPTEWDLFFIGINHQGVAPESVAPGVVRAKAIDRMHCVAVHPRFFAGYLALLKSMTTHVDHSLNAVAADHVFLAADPVLAYQRGGLSTITCKIEPARSWDSRVPV